MIKLVSLTMIVLAGAAQADMIVAARTLPAQTIITADDLLIEEGGADDTLSDPYLFIGMETRVAIYAGRPFNPADVGAPAIVDRNQIIPLVFQQGGLRIMTDGRALGRAGSGESIRVMNLASRNTVTARIDADGMAYAIGSGQ